MIDKPGHAAVLLYSETCPRCVPTILAVTEIFAEAGLPLHLRKPTISELAMPGFAFPALWLPKDLTGKRDDLVLVGDKLADTARLLVRDSRRESVAREP